MKSPPPAKNPKDKPPANLRDGARCKVVAGTHAGKTGLVRDINLSKSGYVTITVVPAAGDRFKTLAKNVVIA
jgi:ribosomal protein S4E